MSVPFLPGLPPSCEALCTNWENIILPLVSKALHPGIQEVGNTGQIPPPGVCPCAVNTLHKHMQQLLMQTKAATKMRTSSLRCSIFLVNNTIIRVIPQSGKYETKMIDGNISGEKQNLLPFISPPFLARAFHFQIFYASFSLMALNSGWTSESPGELGKQLLFRHKARAIRSKTLRVGPGMQSVLSASGDSNEQS